MLRPCVPADRRSRFLQRRRDLIHAGREIPEAECPPYVGGECLSRINTLCRHGDTWQNAAVPVTIIGRAPKEAGVDTVRANSRRGAAEAVRHLHLLRRRRIALLNGPESTAPGSSRRQGYLDGLRSCGLERDDALIEVASDFMLAPGREAAGRLLARTRPDAIFCANDLLALGTLTALRAAGLEVPRDVAVVGMDDTSLAAVSWPPLTSVDLGGHERAKLAFMMCER